MSKWQAGAVFAVVLLIVNGRWHLAGDFGWLVICGLVWRLTIWTHPRTRHRPCRGTGQYSSPIFAWAHRKCGCGNGRIIRWSAARWGSPQIRQEAAAQQAAIRAAPRWRDPA